MTLSNLENTKIIWVEVSSLKEPIQKTRKHSVAKLKKMENCIRNSKVMIPLVVDKNLTIVSGNARFEVAKRLQLKQIPVVRVENLSEAELSALSIADNALTLDAEWDYPNLKIKLEEIKQTELDFNLTCIELPEIDFILHGQKEQKEEVENDDFVEKNVPQRVKSGDLWQLGKHFLFCGNALIEKSYQTLMQGKLATSIISDYPYNLSSKAIGGKGKIKHPDFQMAAGEMNESEFIDFLKNAIELNIKYSAQNSLHYIFMDWRHSYEILTAGKLYPKFKNLCVWNKMCGGMGSLYRSQHELVFVFQNGIGKYINNVELGKHGRNRTNVWDFKGVHVTNPENKDDLKFHPTVKPVKMLKEIVLDCTNRGDIVLDSFVGSGSTILACEETDRCCYAMELEPHYCDIAIYRWENLTKKKATKIEIKGE